RRVGASHRLMTDHRWPTTAALALATIGFTTPSVSGADRPRIEPVRVTTPPVIDGRLDDDVWQGPALALSDWLTYNPLNGEKMAQQTQVLAAYDDRNLYFAFRCLDPEPGKVRGSLSRRDDLWNDDWVGLSLDSLGNGQTSYDLFVNPLGVQGDILTTPSAGENTAPDFVWESAGRGPFGQIRHHLLSDGRGDHQSRLQPGRERRLPGGGQPTLPSLLLGEASLLHGGARHLRAGGRGRRRRHAHRRPYPPDRRSVLGRKGYGGVGQAELRDARRRRRRAGPTARGRGQPVPRRPKGLPDRPRAVQPGPLELRGRDRHRHRVRDGPQPRVRRRRLDQEGRARRERHLPRHHHALTGREG